MKVTCSAVSLILAVAFSFAALVGGSTSALRPQTRPLSVQVRANRNSYLPGEPVALRFRVVNESDARITLEGGADVWRGHLKVLIAYENEGFKNYLGPHWGIGDTIGATIIEPRGFFETEATVLYNHKREISHLNEMYANRITARHVMTDYALPRPGEYRIKAYLYLSENEDRIESEPIQIIVEQPRGDDLEVWNRIKDEPRFAYFIHTGEIMPEPNVARPSSARVRRTIETLEEIITSYPNSRYAEHIRSGLNRFRAATDERRRWEILRENE